MRLPELFKLSKLPADKALYTYLTTSLLPLVLSDIDTARQVRANKSRRLQQETEEWGKREREAVEWRKRSEEAEGLRLAIELAEKERVAGVVTRERAGRKDAVAKSATEVCL